MDREIVDIRLLTPLSVPTAHPVSGQWKGYWQRSK
jgi:hypothetical protein